MDNTVTMGIDSGFQWAIVIGLIGIALAVIRIAVAVLTYRRGRLPSVSTNISSFGSHRAPKWEEVRYLSCRLTCAGADLYDVKVDLECY